MTCDYPHCSNTVRQTNLTGRCVKHRQDHRRAFHRQQGTRQTKASEVDISEYMDMLEANATKNIDGESMRYSLNKGDKSE